MSEQVGNQNVGFLMTQLIYYEYLSLFQDIDECEMNPCSEHGTCNNTPGSYHCVCDNGWTGQHCESGKKQLKI